MRRRRMRRRRMRMGRTMRDEVDIVHEVCAGSPCCPSPVPPLLGSTRRFENVREDVIHSHSSSFRCAFAGTTLK
eukprot:4305989-Pyramimonas_sp.AAC.1